MATMSEVATAAGVSRFTVSKVLNGDATVKASTRERVMVACRKLDFTPNPHAVSLVRGSSRTVGLVVTQLGDPFYAEIIEAADQEARRLDHRLVIACSYGDPSLEADILRHVRALRVCALVLAAVPGEANRSLLDATARQLPLVFVDHAPTATCHAILNDHAASAQLVTRHLLERCAQPAYLGSAQGTVNPAIAARDRGYQEAMAAAGVQPLLLPTGNSDAGRDNERFGYENMNAWLRHAPAPRGLFCATDRIALGAMHALDEHDLSIGREVLVAGHDDLPFSAHTRPPLTSIRQPKREIGTLALTTAVALAAKPRRQAVRHVLPATLVVRASTGEAPLLRHG